MEKPMQLPFFEVRDRRQKEWFWLDNALIDDCAKVLGPNATMVYIALSRHADNELQTCWPSMETIAQECGIGSRNTVAKGIKLLQQHNMIGVEESVNPANGKRLNNVYTLLARHHWKLHIPKAAEKRKETEEHMEDMKQVTLIAPDSEAALPGWMDLDAWMRWETYRKEIRKKLTKSTIKQQVKFLETVKVDHVAIIDQSIQNGWTGLFPLKRNGKAAPVNKQAAAEGKYSRVGQKI